jgi:hypothetical protein
MQQAAVLALLGEACLYADHVDEAANAARARWTSRRSAASVAMRPRHCS